MTDPDSFNQTCLYYAANDSDVIRGTQLMRILLDAGADPNFKDGLNQTALFYSACNGYVDQIQMLAEAGCRMNELDTYGQTPLFYAARDGHVAALEKLLGQYQVNINQVDQTGQTALFYACRDGRLDAIKFLVEVGGINIHQEDKQRQTALTWAKRSGHSAACEYLISKGAIEQTVPTRKRADSNTPRPTVKRNEKAVKCQLMIVDDKGEKRAMTDEELANFEAQHPEIAKYWKDPSTVPELDSITPDQLDSLKPWDKPGKKLINTLWRTTHAWIFHEPVDPIKLGIEDYFDIIKKPMDFGTIKKKLNNNAYKAGPDLVSDFEQVFYNCKMYNKPGTDAYVMCEQVYEMYKKLLVECGLDRYSGEVEIVEAVAPVQKTGEVVVAEEVVGPVQMPPPPLQFAPPVVAPEVVVDPAPVVTAPPPPTLLLPPPPPPPPQPTIPHDHQSSGPTLMPPPPGMSLETATTMQPQPPQDTFIPPPDTSEQTAALPNTEQESIG